MSIVLEPLPRSSKAPNGGYQHVIPKHKLSIWPPPSVPGSSHNNHNDHNDHKDMQRMGKNQELKRMFHALSIFSFTAMIQGTWIVVIFANYQGLQNGGMAGLFWSFIWTFVGFAFIVLSLAEMASMAPTSGGQYHWVSEFAPPRYQKCLSYLTGWISIMSWQSGVAGGVFLTGTITQKLIVLNCPSYDAPRWQGTLCVIVVIFIVLSINIFGAKRLPFLQNVFLVLHVLSFVAIMIVLWVVARIQPTKAVFTHFENNGGWNSMGLSLMVGQVTSVYMVILSDAAAHMSEEVQDAGLVIPRAMTMSYVMGGVTGLISLTTFLFCISNVSDALNDSTGFPFLYVLRSSMSDGAATAITVIMLFLGFMGLIDGSASASRQIWAFARDRGVPFFRWISHVHPTRHIPDHALVLTAGIAILLSLINIGSTTAFNAIVSLQLSSLMIGYAVSIACVLYRRLYHPERLPRARWSLGRFGPAINGAGLTYAIFVFFWCFWPIQAKVDASTFNWAMVMFVTLAVVSGMTYFWVGRWHYRGPVSLLNYESRWW